MKTLNLSTTGRLLNRFARALGFACIIANGWGRSEATPIAAVRVYRPALGKVTMKPPMPAHVWSSDDGAYQTVDSPKKL